MYLDWQKQNTAAYVIDIEADSLTPTRIWCMCWANLKTGETGECRGHKEIRDFFDTVGAAIFIGHNILKFDGPVLNRICGTRLSPTNCIDSLVLSTLYSPSLSGGHSLGAWGERLGKGKIHFDDFSALTDEMVKYCHQDVAITAELFKRLTKTLARIGFSEQSIWIQHRFTVLIERQHKNGFYFDGPRALGLYQELRLREKNLEELIHVAFPPELTEIGQYKKAYKQDGSFNAGYQKHLAQYPRLELHDDGGYSAFDYIAFSVGSPKQRVNKLIELGWEPQEFTEKGTPKPFDKGKLSPSLEKFLEDKDISEVRLIAKWMAINGRANMINTWLDNWNEIDSCIHGKLFVADTLRLRHQAPNTANIPAVRVKEHKDSHGNVIRKEVLYRETGYYTYEARDLWTARPDRVLVGTDAAGLELRMLAHYLNRPAFTKQVVEGDPHQYNADLVGITRPQAKTLIYAVLYGAAAPKIAKTLGVSVREGGRIRNMFLERLGLKELIEEAQYEQEHGRVLLCDGSLVVCPSPHAALNYKLQGGGARVMARAAIMADNYIRRDGLDSLKVGDIHDEWQHDTEPRDAEQYGRRSVESIRDAGEELGLNVPLDGEAKVGRTWAETH